MKNAGLERRLRTFAVVVAGGAIAGLAFNVSQGRLAVVGVTYGILMSATLAGIELFVLDGSMRSWLNGFSFTVSFLIRSAIYVAVIALLQWLQIGELVAGLPRVMSGAAYWSGFGFSVAISVLFNLIYSITNLIGGRALLHFISGRYHAPVEESRFVLFVDIEGSTRLAEQLGGVGIHRFLDRTFRLLTVAVEDHRGEVLNYVGDEIIVTWRERAGAVDCRPLQCFKAMREALSRAAGQLEREFGAAAKIRGSLHFGPVIVGEIGDVKRAIVFNGDVMNTAARLEEMSRNVDGGFLASRAAMDRFGSEPPFAVRDLGRLAIRGRGDGIDVFGLAPALA